MRTHLGGLTVILCMTPFGGEGCAGKDDTSCVDASSACLQGRMPLADADAVIDMQYTGGIEPTLAPAGDVNGDGYDDFAVGAEDDATSGRYSGALYLVEGPAGSLSTIDEAFAEWTGPNAWQYVENAEGGKDLDGDGQPDLVIGNDGVDDEVNGSTWVLRGPFESGTHSLATADATWMGEYRHNGGGFSLALLDDTNADGYADLLVGAVDYDDAGAAYLILGGPD